MKFTPLRGAGLLCLLVFSLLTPIEVRARLLHATKRDHLTPQEIELVREAQELDKRTAVFVKAAERRLLALTNPSGANNKDTEKWGELKGSRADFLSDLSKILDEAITNIDDVSARDERNPLVPKALRSLSEASTRILAQLAPLRDQTTNVAERNWLESAIENAEAVVEASGKLPPPAPKGNKKKDSKKQSR